MTRMLHRHNIAHGDLKHENIFIKADGSILLIDYDSVYVPGLDGEADEIKGVVSYLHPNRFYLSYLSPKLDYFSESIIYVHLIALSEFPELWDTYDLWNPSKMLFDKDDFYK